MRKRLVRADRWAVIITAIDGEEVFDHLCGTKEEADSEAADEAFWWKPRVVRVEVREKGGRKTAKTKGNPWTKE
jgi:hypothetical protein